MPLYKSTGRVLEAKKYPPLATYTNLVTNASFESDLTGWTVGGPSVPTVDIATYYAGLKSIKSIQASQSSYAYMDIACTNGHTVYASVWVYIYSYTSGSDNVIELTDYGTFNNTVAQTCNHAIIGQWQRVTAVKTAASGGIRLLLGTTNLSTRTVYIDAGMAIDRTDIFGSGNEPTAAWCDTNLPFVVSSGTALRPIDKMLDRSRFANHGTFSGTTWVQLASGIWVMNFDGADDYVQMADSPELRMKLGGTFEAWIYPIGLGEGESGRIIDKSTDANGTNGYRFSIYSIADKQLAAKIDNGTILLSSNNAITLNTWQRAAVTFDSTGRHLYVNGADVTSSGGTETALPPNVAGVVAIGNRAGAADRSFYGYIAPPSIYDYARTQAQILAKYTAERWWYGV